MVCPRCSKPLRHIPTKVIPKRQNQLSKKRKSKADKPSPWIDRLKDGENKNDVPASAKTLAFKSDILNLFQLDTNAKIIIFREWREMLDILERVCEIEGWNCVKIHGQVSIAERNARLDAFRTGDFSGGIEGKMIKMQEKKDLDISQAMLVFFTR
jgi:SNF2 family DNA or RNA helicase